ncbi:MAG: prolipoprotein diacylglyceryl transferase [Alphaproteobacteria bacterium]|nr:prolipoprotein diacylglyceryl transferase [Alphaproteobacteria bacterium]
MLAILFPPLDPVAFEAGPIVIRWYALAYLAGFLLGWRYCMALAAKNKAPPGPQDYDDFLVWAVLGVIIGGRAGYVLFYQFDYFLQNPLDILQVWHGGMSFHGGAAGVIAAIIIFSCIRKFSILAFGDLICCAVPIGLFFGRIANFVNAELFGRVTDVPWGVVFPRGGDMPRHPSQFYEAALEGVLLFTILFFLARMPAVRQRPGTLSGVFLAGYGLFRFSVEFFREPDVQLGYLAGGLTMGQYLCMPMLVVGAGLVLYARGKAARKIRGA